ncbi:hemicentin-1-like [Patiria miniata]|uniref:Uncharacterized protein n=1 Tax=Patiria miniata TaxID=46514 RepID=A0A914AG73_PATMI|nr:hemicentin-1-like [Patiria miniata]
MFDVMSTGTYIGAGGRTHVYLYYYGDNEYRTWTVTTASNRRIRISFSSFDTEGYLDVLRIVDTSTGQEWTFSGSSLPGDVVSTGSNLQLTFTSDYSVTSSGFSLWASSIPKPTPPVTSSLSLRDASGTRLLGEVTVLEGAPYIFTCDVQDTSPAATIRWYLDGALKKTAYAPSRGEYSLVDTSDAWILTPSRVNQSQEVKCVASNTVSQEPFPYVNVTLDVYVPPSTIELWDSYENSTTNNDTFYLVAGVEHQFSCVVPSINPGADFNWTLGSMVLTEDSSNDTSDGDGLITSISVITLNPFWAYHGKNLRCSASNYDGFPTVNISLTIDVKVPPTQSSLSIYDPEGTRLGQTAAVDQGKPYNFTCEVQGTRPAATTMWFIGDALQRTFIPPSGIGDDLVDTSDSWTFAPNRSIHGQQLRCMAGTPESQEPLPFVTTALNVNVLPTVISLYDWAGNTSFVNGTSYLIAGVEHEFTCEVPGIDPAASMTWTLGSQGITSNITKDIVGSDGLTNSSSTVTVSPTWNNQGELLQCHAFNKPGYPGLNVSVTLDVKVPPQESSVFLLDLDGFLLGTSVDVDEGSPETFTCVVQDTRPAATIEWFLNGVLESTVSPAEGQSNGLVNTTGTWTLTPETKHHRQVVMCAACTAEASRPFPFVTVSLNVKVLPKEIFLFDSRGTYSSNDTAYLIEGVDHRFTCVVPDINPRASFTWTVANQEFSNSSEVTSNSGFLTSASHVRMAPSWADHGQELLCRATNREGHVGISTGVVLDIKVPPRSSSISLYDASGTSLVNTFVVDQGSPSSLRCEIQGTRPAVAIGWFLNGNLQRTADPHFGEDIGLVNTSDTWSFTPSRANHGQEVRCVASTAESQEPLPSKALNLEVNGPPDLPWIVGNTTMTEGVTTTLTCYADMGFPDDWLLYWSFGDVYDIANLTTVPSASDDRFMFTSALNVTPTRDDNGKTITCTARKDSWTVHPTTTYGPINVHFCPRWVSITNCPLKAIPDSMVSFRCVSESSNPITNLTWLRNGRRKTNPAPPALPKGDYGGHVTTEDFTTAVLTKEDNGALFTCCTAKTTACPADVCDSCSLNVEYRPYFSEPKATTPSPVREGGDVILSCGADANPMPPGFITWEKVGSPDSLPSVYSDGTSNLTLSSISREQAGPYRCRGDNGVPPVVFSNPIDIAVYYEVNITNKADTYVGAADGEGAVLLCTAKGNPLPLTVWLDPTNEEINNDTDAGRIIQAVTSNGGDDIYGYSVTSILEIKRVTAEGDYGYYTCYSGNGVGRVDMLHIHLNIKVVPSSPYDVSIDEERITADSVTITWRPGAEVGTPQWFYVNYRELGKATDFDPSTRSQRLQGSNEYTVEGLRPYAMYEVEVYAENAHGRSEAVKTVVKTLHCPVFTDPTSLTTNPVDEGDDITLSCSADANPMPTDFITWEKVGSPDSLPSVYSDGTSNLTLSSVNRKQAGPYRCRGNNGVPPVIFSRSIDVIVLYEAAITSQADNCVEADDGEAAILTCTVKGNPHPLIRWLSPTRTRMTNHTEPGRITQVDTISGGDVVYGYTVTSTLHIKNVTGIGDYGFYVCTCGNGVGRVDALSIQLTSRVLPAAPMNVSIEEAMNTATTITVSWTPRNEAAPNIWFHVNYRELATTDDFDPNTRSDRLHGVTSFTLMGLRPYSVYEVEVYAANGNGVSEAVTIIGTTALCTRMVSITGCPYRIVSGGSVSLSCVSESTNPATNLTWLRDNVEQTGHPGLMITDGDYGGRMTTLDFTTGALTRTDNGGEYKCCAARPSVCTADVCDTCSLNVEYRPFFSEPMVLTPGPVEEGDDVILSCSADANPMPADFITWEKVGSPDSLASVYSDGTSTLTLRSITKEQTGSYRCRGNNGIPPVVFSTPVDIIVHFGVTITNPENNYAEANVGERATLVCTAEGNPYPMTTWLGPTGTRITNQSHPGRITLVETIHGRGGVEGYTVTNTLQINTVSGAEDYGYYVCDCGNGIGMVDTLTILLNSRVEPVPPTNISIDQGRITAYSLTVNWIPGTKVVGPEQWILVNYRELVTTTSFSPSTRSGRLYDVSEYTVVGLRADTEYEVEVYAENANGASDVVTIIGKTLPELDNATPEPLIGITRGTGDATKETSTALELSSAEVDNTTPELNAETSAAYDVMRTSKSQAVLGNATPQPLIEITSATSDVIKETSTTLPEVDNTTPEPNDETPADYDVMSKSQGQHEAERRAYVVVEQGYSLLVAGIIVVSIVAFISIMVAVAVFVYHRRSTTNNLEITARKTKLTRASIKYDEESDVVMEKAENLDIPLQVLTSDSGEATREHGSTSN